MSTTKPSPLSSPGQLARLAIIPIWIAALWGSLQIHQLDLNLGHDICGPWGCGPPLEALLGIHGFWLALILPAACLLGLYLSRETNRSIGKAILIVGVIALIAFVGGDVIRYYLKTKTAEHLVQRAFFTLVMCVDFPLIPTLLAGSLLTFVFGRPRNTVNEPNTEPQSPFAPE